jgi:hypothetical protein
MFGLLFNPEDGGDMFFQNSVEFQQTTHSVISQKTVVSNKIRFIIIACEDGAKPIPEMPSTLNIHKTMYSVF